MLIKLIRHIAQLSFKHEKIHGTTRDLIITETNWMT